MFTKQTLNNRKVYTLSWYMFSWSQSLLVVGGAITSCAGISAAFVCTSSSKQIYPVSVQSDFLAGEVSAGEASAGMNNNTFYKLTLKTVVWVCPFPASFCQIMIYWFHSTNDSLYIRKKQRHMILWYYFTSTKR